MSEYQRYEFLAIDRPLNRVEQRKVREFSTRARITATVFENEYHWGDFKGDPILFLQNWYDVFVYVANWGTHKLGLALPESVVDMQLAKRCCGKHARCLAKKGRVIVDLVANLEEPPDYEEEEPGMGELSPVRTAALHGDERFWYLCWLLGVQQGEVKDKEEEPVVPVGLGELGGDLKSLAYFLYIDPKLLGAAAKDCGRLQKRTRQSISSWIKTLPAAERDALLAKAAVGDISAEMMRRMQAGSDIGKTRETKTAGILRREAAP